MPVRAGQTLAHYRLVEKIGEGGMGVVWRARDEHLERDVAVKVLRPGTVADESTRVRFRREALALSRLNHPNIATVYDFDSQDEVDFLVMEYVRGTTLHERLAGGSLTEGETIVFGMQLADGLSAAHAEGVLHRDLKPGNLRITPDDRLKILDFGLAKVFKARSDTAPTETQTRGVVGTLAYMAPEQLRGAAVDERTDLYAAGAVLYVMATGKRPFPEPDTAHLVYSVLRRSPEPPRKHDPGISEGLQNLVLKAMAKRPAERYATAIELREDLERLREGRAPGAKAPGTGRRRRAAAVAAIALVLAVVAGWAWRERGSSRGSGPIGSVAVLPLENLSGDSAQEYFADGMTEALITDLGKLGRLGRVISRRSVVRFKGSELSLREIARELDVQALVVGSATQDGERIRITAQLIRAEDEEILWSDDYVRRRADVLILQGDVARAIAREILGALTGPEQSRITRTRTIDPEVYEAYVKGRLELGGGLAPEPDMRSAIVYFKTAIDGDPSYAEPYAGLGEAYFWLSFYGHLAPIEAIPPARAALARALELDPDLAEAHASMGRIAQAFDRDWQAADEYLRRAIELDPNSYQAHMFYSVFLLNSGRFEQAIEHARIRMELEPTMPRMIGWQYHFARQYDVSIAKLEESLESEPELAWAIHMELAWNYAMKEMMEKAVSEIELAAETAPDPLAVSLASQGWVYGLAGRRQDALAILDRFEELETQGYVDAYYPAWVHAGLGDADGAMEWLERAYAEHSLSLPALGMATCFDSLRSDPRYVDLMQRVGVPRAAGFYPTGGE